MSDPSGAHAYRWWDGQQWTEHVSDGGGSVSADAPGADLPPPLRLSDPVVDGGPSMMFTAHQAQHPDGANGTPAVGGSPSGVAASPAHATAVAHQRPAGQAVEYKVLTQKDRALSRKFDPYVLEAALNEYAREGWRVVSSATAEFPGFLSGQREELIIVLERTLR